MVQSDSQTAIARRAFDEEAEKLADVREHIENEGIRLRRQMPVTASSSRDADAIQEILLSNADSLASALDQPYFGRLDYYENADNDESPEAEPSDDDANVPETPPKTIYLGTAFIPGKGVFNWTAPVGRLWYTQSHEDGYTAPRGYIATRVDLKRHLRIRDGELLDVNEIFRRQLPAPSSGRQDVLTEALSGAGGDDGHLQVIIETIEPEQYENIANVSDNVLIVQGAAGSGKSEIGLHRIAFLLSPFSHLPERERPTPATTLFVGPSKAFLEYASDILPSLGVREEVARVKFSDWLRGHISQPRTRIGPRIWNDLLNNGEMRNFDERAETFKGSLLMADVIDRHVNETAAEIRRRIPDLPESIPGLEPDGKVSKDQIERALNDVLPTSARGQGLNNRREDFIERIERLVRPTAQIRTRQQTVFEEMQRRSDRRIEVGEWCDGVWK